MVDEAEWRALGTGVRLVVLDGDLSAARGAVEQVLAEADRAYSRFRLDSELSSVNAQSGRAVTVTPVLARAIEGALEAARRTGGAVDPTVGRAMRLIGYDRDFGLLADSNRPLELLLEPVPGWTTVSFDGRRRTVRVPRGVELDLGSTGKGLAADLAATRALAVAGPGAGVLVSLGGDVATAGGAPVGGWRILVVDDSATPPDGNGELIAIDHGAVATSSTTVRRWQSSSGVNVHHIVDPRTGLPALTPWRTVSVVAGTAELANAASTAAIVMGDDAPDWLRDHGLAARLAMDDSEVIRLGGWPEPSAAIAARLGNRRQGPGRDNPFVLVPAAPEEP